MSPAPVFDPDHARDRGARTPGDRAPRPRPAATLILLDHTGPAPRVLMGRRHGGHDFMPDKWVFPGGRVDPGDHRARVSTDLRPETAAPIAALFPRRPTLPRALGVAAVRETWEEAGLHLGPPDPGGATLPDLAALDLLARAVTPPMRHKRFDAVFFTADAARLQSRERTGGSGELGDIAWFTLDEALRLDLPSVTSFVLTELGLRLADPSRPVLSLRMLHGRHRQDAL